MLKHVQSNNIRLNVHANMTVPCFIAAGNPNQIDTIMLRNRGMHVKVRVHSPGLLESPSNVVRILTSWPTVKKME